MSYCKMEMNNTVQALDNLDSTLKKFEEQIDRETSFDIHKQPEQEHDSQEKEDASDKNKDNIEEGNKPNCDKGKTDTKIISDKDNQKTACDQYNAKSGGSEKMTVEKSTCIAAKPRRPSEEDIAKNWLELGVKRCKNCRFTTDDTELFKQHCTTCLSDKSTATITMTYKNGEFKCNTCNEVWKIKGEFEEHIVCHLQDWPYVCLTCQNRKFPSRQLIEMHTKKDHPLGDARCGLKGMKNGRKYCEELMQSGAISINGKVTIPKTPKNHAYQIVPKELTNQKKDKDSTIVNDVNASTNVSVCGTNINNPAASTVLPSQLQAESILISSELASAPKVSGATIHHRPILVNVVQQTQSVTGVSQVQPSKDNSNNIVSPVGTVVSFPVILKGATTMNNTIVDNGISHANDSDTDVISNRPMPPARTTVNFQTLAPYPHQYTSKGGTLTRISAVEEAKTKHLDTLFGQINRSTNVMQPTFISQKIKDIANPMAGDSKRTLSDAPRKEAIPYHLKTITEYTCTQPTKPTTTSSVSPIQNLLLVPVGPPISMTPNSQLLNNVFCQQPSSSGNFIPIQTMPSIRSGTDTNIRLQQTPNITVQRLPVNQIPQTTGSVTIVRSLQSNTPVRSSIQDANVRFGTLKSVASTSRILSSPHVASGKSINVQQGPTTQTALTSDILAIPKKYLFKIKPGIGFVCEACKKCTREEYVFRRHVWEHFHGNPLACKTCSTDLIASRMILECKLVNNIVCNLIRRSTQETLEASAMNLKVTKFGDKEVIDITDDDESNKNDQQDQQIATEVIVLDDDDENGDAQGLQIRISNTFSLSSPQNLEQMAKKDDLSNIEAISSDLQTGDKQNERNKDFAVSTNDLSEMEEAKQIGKDGTNKKLQSGKKQSEISSSNRNIGPSSETPKNADDTQQILSINLGEEDDDGKLKDAHLLDQSLSEPGKDSEEIVSKVLETNLKLFDPSLTGTKDDDFFSEAKQPMKTSNIQLDGSANIHQEDQDESNKAIFDSEILSKQSHQAFYVCGYENCSYTGLSSIKYREHLQSKQHGKEYNYVCGHCGQKDYTEDAHVRHLFSHANAKRFLLYKCPMHLCKYKTNLLHMYTCHLRAHPTEELTVMCIYCHKTFPTIETLEQHLKQNLLKFVVCPYCSFKFVNKHYVMLHIRFFHPDKMRMVSVTSQVVCNEREINFYVPPKSLALYESYLKEKEMQETQDIDIPALLNDFQRESDASEKNGSEQKESENGDGDDALSLPEEDQGDLKEERSEEIRSNQKEIHEKRTSKPKMKGDSSLKGGPKSLECPQCSYLSYNQSFHAKHISLHDTEPEREKRFVCNLCPKGTDGLAHFITHVKNHVGKHVIKIFCCTTCAYCSNQKRHIMDHVKDAHAEEALYTLKEEVVESNHFECKYCSFKARTVEQVNAHETCVHRIDQNVISNGDKEVQRPSVNESSSTSLDSGKKKKCKYHCEYCNEHFKHKSNLKEHMMNDHKDIDNKQFIFFKCKYCTYTSTMKDMIINHLEKDHSGQDLRILRKIEMVENGKYVNVKSNNDAGILGMEGKHSEVRKDDQKANEPEEMKEKDKIEIVVPDGNIFKQMFSCPICSFTTNMRIKAMKHLKEHPDVKPVRPDQKKCSTKPTARKSSSSMFPKNESPIKKNSLIQQVPNSAKALQNPFSAVKESVVENFSGELNAMPSSPSKDLYILGEQKLHSALSACFIPFEKDMKYQCRICKQKIFKRFVLHRHILDHLKIVFFKCKYCDEGSIERTLMVGHIQKVHSSKSILYDSVDASILEQQFKERIFSQDFNDTPDLSHSTGTRKNLTGELNNSNIVKKPVHEYQTIDDESDNEEDGTSDVLDQELKEVEVINTLKCLQCRYVARSKHHLNLHLDSHKDPLKVFTCSVCDYRGDKFSAIKHVYSVPHLTQAKVLENGKSLYPNLKKCTDDDQVQNDCNTSSSKTNVSDQSEMGKEDDKLMTESKNVKNEQGKQIKRDNLTVTKSGTFEMKTSYKCKECGEKRESKSGIYAHFRTTKCSKPVMKCSLCSFQNTIKAAIYRHASKRHPSKKITILDLPMSAKFKLIKIPIRIGKGTSKQLPASSSFEPTDSPSEVMSDVSEKESWDKKQIKCQLCSSYSCESVMKLQFHINTTHQGAMLYCKECSYKTPLVRHMMNHCQNLHLQKFAQYDKTPKKKNESKENAKQEKVSKPVTVNSEDKEVIQCPKCEIKFGSIFRLNTHMYSHFNYKPICCKYCDKVFARTDHCKSHIRAQHVDKPVKFVYKTDEALESKIRKIYESVKRSATKQRIMLGKNRPSKLNKMELIEEGIRKRDKKFYCDFCQYHSDRRTYVRNHVSTVHAGISKKRPLVIDSDTESPVLKSRKKEDCKKEDCKKEDCDFNDASIDEEEDEKEEEEDELQPLKYKVVKTPKGSKKFKCSGCDYVNSKKKNVKLHVARHHSGKTEDVLKCLECSFTSANSSKICTHYKARHPTMKVVKCINKVGEVVLLDMIERSSPGKYSPASSPARSCTESVTSDISPVKQEKKKLNGVTRFNCIYCDYSGEGFFHFRLHLVKHEQFTKLTTELDEESKMACGYCTYLGKNTFDLSVHIASHMADVRYKCAYCDFNQFTVGKVSQHIKHSHPDRKEMVIDRQLRKTNNGEIQLINFNPEVKIDPIKGVSRKRKYKRIMIETDESSNNSSSDIENDRISSSKSIEKFSKDESQNANDINDEQVSCCKELLLVEGKDGESKHDKLIEEKINFSDEKEDTNIQSLQPGKLQNDVENEKNMSKDSELISAPFYKVESQPFSPSDVNDIECDELDEDEFNIIDSKARDSQMKERENKSKENDVNSNEKESIWKVCDLNTNAKSVRKINDGKTNERESNKKRNEVKAIESDDDVKSNDRKSTMKGNDKNANERESDGKANYLNTVEKRNDSVTCVTKLIENVSQRGENGNSFINESNIYTPFSSDAGDNNYPKCTESHNSEQGKSNTVRKHGNEEDYVSECDAAEIDSENQIDKSVENVLGKDITTLNTLICDKSKSADVHTKELSHCEEKEESITLNDSEENKNEFDPDSEKMKKIGDKNCDTDERCKNIEKTSVSNTDPHENTDAVNPDDDTSKTGYNENIPLDDEILGISVGKNSGKDASCNEDEMICSSTNSFLTSKDDDHEVELDSNKSSRNVFESISNAGQSECIHVNMECTVINKKCIMKNEKNVSSEITVNEKTDENVFEKFSTEMDDMKMTSDTETEVCGEKESEDTSDNIFEKFSQSNEVKVGASSDEKITSEFDETDKNIFESFAKDTDETLNDNYQLEANREDDKTVNTTSTILDAAERKTNIKPDSNSTVDKDSESNIFNKFSTDNLDVTVPEVSEDQPKSSSLESNIFSKFSSSEYNISSKLQDDEKVSDKNVFEQFSKESSSKESSEAQDGRNVGHRSLQDAEDKLIEDKEKTVEDMEIDELINSIEETVNEGKSKQSDTEKYDHEFEDNCEMEVD